MLHVMPTTLLHLNNLAMFGISMMDPFARPWVMFHIQARYQFHPHNDTCKITLCFPRLVIQCKFNRRCVPFDTSSDAPCLRTKAPLNNVNPIHASKKFKLLKHKRFLYVPKGLTFKNSTWCSLCVECFVWISEQTATSALYIINWLAYTTVVERVYCAVRTDSLYKADHLSSLKV